MKVVIVLLWLAACAYGQERPALEKQVSDLNALLDRAIVLLDARERELRELRAEVEALKLRPAGACLQERIDRSDAWGRIGAGLYRRPLLSPVLPSLGAQPLFRQTICTPLGSSLNCTSY